MPILVNLDVLLAQQADLSKAIEELIEDIEAGRKYMKTYKQMKMYNDPALNPVLYGQKSLSFHTQFQICPEFQLLSPLPAYPNHFPLQFQPVAFSSSPLKSLHSFFLSTLYY